MNQKNLFRSSPEIACEFQGREKHFAVAFLTWEDIYLVVVAVTLYNSWKPITYKKDEEEVITLKALFAPLNLAFMKVRLTLANALYEPINFLFV